MPEEDLGQVLADVIAAATDSGAHVVDAILSLNNAKVPVAGTDPAATVALIRSVRPRIVYCTGIRFDAGEQILVDLFDDDADEALLERPRIKRLVTKWRKRDGQIAQVTCSVMVDGILHGFIVDAAWYAEYEAEVETHGEETERLNDERARREETEAKKRLGPMVQQLMTDTRFSGPKVGGAKRLTLARSLFPDADQRILAEVVDMAESTHWLTTTG